MNQPIQGNPFELPSTPIAFLDHPEFTPYYSPNDMLRLGVFAGMIFNRNSYTYGIGTNTFLGLRWQQYSQTQEGNFSVNATYVDAPQRRRDTNIPENIRQWHPAGWFQWYAQFYNGSRSKADKYRIAQWTNEVNTIYFKYIQACTAASVLPNVWVPGSPPPDSVLVWIQHLLHFSWPFNQQPNL